MLISKKPASDFSEAYPIGNGKLGAMVYGGLSEEQILLNQDSIWYGVFIDRNNPERFLSALPVLQGFETASRTARRPVTPGQFLYGDTPRGAQT